MVILAGGSLFSCKNQETEIRLLFTGDILLSRNVKQEINTHKNFPWDSLQSLFLSADYVVGNLEGATGEYNRRETNQDISPFFAIESDDIPLLHQAGFTAVTLENNHIYDLGQEGKSKTKSTLDSNDIQAVSAENSPFFFQIESVVFSLVAINLVPNKDSSCHKIPSLEILRKLRLAKKLSNIVIVSVHWGNELLDWPSQDQREAAEWLIMNGADVIIGHHPHVIQAPELIHGKPVFYSLGNHLFDQKYSSTKEGLIADIRIKNGKIICKGIFTHTDVNSFYPIISDSINFQFIPASFCFEPFEINGITLVPHSYDIENKVIFNGFHEEKMIWKSNPVPLVDVDKIRIDDTHICLFTLEQHYSSLDKEITFRPYVYQVDEKGMTARWRGSGLAWPILDAIIIPVDDRILCALHRGDAFISVGSSLSGYKTAAYLWNGFGFNMSDDSISCERCRKLYQSYLAKE